MPPRSIDVRSGTRRRDHLRVVSDRGDKPPKSFKVKDRGSLEAQLRRLGPYPRSADTLEQLARMRLDWHTAQSKIRDAHRRREALRDAQERNFPTEEISVDLPEGQRRVRRNMTRVRQSEAWRHKQIDVMQRQAEGEMQIAWQVRTAGLGPASPKYHDGRVSGYHGSLADDSIGIEQDWLEWFRKALGRRIPIAVVLEILTEPRTLTEIEKGRKLNRGEALEAYKRGLDLWCELRGWKRRNA